MNASQLVNRIAELRSDLDPSEQLRFALIIAMQPGGLEQYISRESLEQACHDVACQISATSDQHAAVAAELESLAETEPSDFSPNHLWMLVKAIKVQSQILDLYLGVSESAI